MEIGWLGILLLLISWACMSVSTGFAFYVNTKDKDYIMSKKDKDYILVTGITSAVAVALTTIVTLLIIFMGRSDYKKHVNQNHQLTLEKMELENRVNDLNDRVEQHRHEKHPSVLENPIPLRRGRHGRPLIT
jgi:hypothetical protein